MIAAGRSANCQLIILLACKAAWAAADGRMEHAPGESAYYDEDLLQGFQFKLYVLLEEGDNELIRWHDFGGVQVCVPI